VKIVVQSDGGISRSRGRGAGAAVAFNQAGVRLAERARIVRDGTVPVCEYVGLIVGLRMASDLGADHVECWMDAELVVRQVDGRYRCRDEKLKPYLVQALDLMDQFKRAEVKEFPKAGPKNKRRYLNGEADALAAECIKLGRSIDRTHYEVAR